MTATPNNPRPAALAACNQCGNTFTPVNANTRYCTVACRYRHKDANPANRARQAEAARRRYQTDEQHRARKLQGQRAAYRARTAGGSQP